MRHAVFLSALAGALVLAASAQGGGWATVGFTPLPDGTAAGAAWSPRITVLQHGRTPLGGLTPVVSIRDDGSGDVRTFTATETSEVGVYEARVVFPVAGSWRVTVDSGFGGDTGRVTYGPVAIGVVPTVGEPRSFPVLPVLAVALLALGVTALVGVRGVRRLRPASG